MPAEAATLKPQSEQKVKKFSDFVHGNDQETDRLPLKADDVIDITGCVFSTNTRYGEIAKVNGIDPKTNQFIKRYTVSKTLVEDLQSLTDQVSYADGSYKETVRVKVAGIKSGSSGRTYLKLADPE